MRLSRLSAAASLGLPGAIGLLGAVGTLLAVGCGTGDSTGSAACTDQATCCADLESAVGQQRCLGSLPPSQALSEPCNLEYGIDACGALLFCAALAGRDVPTCYPERSLLNGERCTEDRQCSSGGCAIEEGMCKAMRYEGCTREVGCASADDVCGYFFGFLEPICGDPANRQKGSACSDHKECNAGLLCWDGACY